MSATAVRNGGVSVPYLLTVFSQPTLEVLEIGFEGWTGSLQQFIAHFKENIHTLKVDCEI